MIRYLPVPLALLTLAASASPAEAQRFSGPRVEATIGYDRLNDETDYPANLGTPGTLDGVRVGGAVGYDVAVSPAITLGAEASAGWTTGSLAVPVALNPRASFDFGRDLDLLFRLGVRVGPSTLVYAKAGYANSRIDFSYTSAVNGAQLHASDIADGWRAGLGIEKALAGGFYAKGEYRYTGYLDETYNDNARHQLLLGAGYRF